VTASHVTAVIFDLGGVLIDWSPEYLYRELIPDADERHHFLTRICSPEWNHQMDAGRSVPDAVATLADLHPEQAELINAWWSRWPEMLGGEIPGTRTIVETFARAGMPLYALTNWSAQTWPFAIQRYSWIEGLFDGVVVSGQEHVAKPDPRIFEILNRRYGLEPTTTMFIDDSPANIQTAANSGYVTHAFTTVNRLETWLHEHGHLDRH